MATSRLLIVSLSLSFLSYFQQISFAGDYKLVTREHSISLYERWIQHNGGPVRELKAEFTVNTNVEKVIALLKNEQKGLIWNNHASVYKIIPEKQQQAWMAYIQYDIPWPMDDYDCLLAYHTETRPASGITEILFKSIQSNRFPVSADITRITGTKGKWILEKQKDGLKITYLITTDRNKSIPRWVSDPVIHNNLFTTMTRFKDLLEKP